MSKRKTTEQFITECKSIYSENYDYSQTYYIGALKHVFIICPNNHNFHQQATYFLKGNGCPVCKGHYQTKDQFIDKANNVHNHTYSYESCIYVNATTKVAITCNIHGVFYQKPTKHTRGQGCPICNSSKGELSIAKWLNSNNLSYVKEKRYDDCKHKYTLPFDFYIPSLNMCIEYDGEQHYSPMRFKGKEHEMKENLKVIQLRDSIKTQYCADNNIKLLRIPYTEYDSIYDILKINITF